MDEGGKMDGLGSVHVEWESGMRVWVFKGGEVVGLLRPFVWVGGESVVRGEPGRVLSRLFVLGCIRGHPESAGKGDVDLLEMTHRY